jgi:hypothetical protein
MEKTIEVSSLMQKKRHLIVIWILQKDVDHQARISSFLLFIMVGACNEIRDSESMLAITD